MQQVDEPVDLYPKRSVFWKLLNPKVAIPLALVLAVLLWPLVFRYSHLARVADIGAPFDVEAFCSVNVPDDENAFTLYRQAAALFTREPAVDFDVYTDEMLAHWTTTAPEMKQWVDDNRAALEVWKQGTQRPRAQYLRANQYSNYTILEGIQECRYFARLARLEVSRLESEGDLEGAWQLIAAMRRSGRHVGQNGCFIERLVGVSIQHVANETALEWAAQPKVTEAMLQQALADVREIYAESEPISTSIKIEYLMFQNTLKLPMRNLIGQLNIPWKGAEPVVLFLRCEPEFGRRVMQHWFADLLERHVSPAEAAHIPQHLSPTELKPLIAESPVANWLVPAATQVENAIVREQAWQAAFEMALAAHIYYRRNGRFPENAAQLLGSGLDAIPVDPFASSGQSMQFRLDDKTGEAIIWSVGENGIDDGGNIKINGPDALMDVGHKVQAPAKQDIK